MSPLLSLHGVEIIMTPINLFQIANFSATCSVVCFEISFLCYTLPLPQVQVTLRGSVSKENMVLSHGD